MKNTRKRLFLRQLALVLALVMLLTTAAFALTVEEAAGLLEKHYIDEVPQEVLDQPTIEEMLEALGDPYTVYMDPEYYALFQASMLDTQMVGIGIVSQQHDQGLLILTVFDDSPAAAAGFVPGDIITVVDGQPCEGVAAATIAQWLQGEEGTTVSVQRIRVSGGEATVTLERAVVVIPATTSELVGSTGLIVCTTFGEDTLGHFEEAMEEYGGQVTSWMVDLRSNSGGDVAAATNTLGVFLGEKIMAYLRNGAGEYLHFQSEVEAETIMPVVVLTNASTASSAEIFAAASRDYAAGVIIGERTFGKGVAQIVLDSSAVTGYFNDGSAMKITAYRYYGPSGTTTDTIGIIPHLLVDGDIAQEVGELLTSGDVSNQEASDLLRIHVGNWRWYVDLTLAEEKENEAAFTALFEALSPIADVYLGQSNGSWVEISVEAMADVLDVPFQSRYFTDVVGNPYEDSINTLATYGIVKGGDDGTFNPDGEITRAELATMLAQAMNLDTTVTWSTFSDVDTFAWYAPSVMAMVDMGLMEGDGQGRFNPDGLVTQEEMLTVIGRLAVQLNIYFALDLEYGATEEALADDSLAQYSDWAQEWVWLLAKSQKNLLGGTLNLLPDDVEDIDPSALAQRDYTAAVLYSVFEEIGLFGKT